MAAFLRPLTVEQHRTELQQAILPHLDDILEASFLNDVVSFEAYTQVIKCNSENKPRRFCLAIQQCVTRSAKNYKAFLKLLKEKLPKEHSPDLLCESNPTLKKALSSFARLSSSEGIHTSFSAPLMGRSVRAARATVGGYPAVSERPELAEEESEVGGETEEGGGLHFSVQCTDENADPSKENEQTVNPVQEEGDIVRERKEKEEGLKQRWFQKKADSGSPKLSKVVAESLKDGEQSINPVQEEGDNREREEKEGLKQRKLHKKVDNDTPKVTPKTKVVEVDGDRRGILIVLERLRNSKLDCQQLEAKVRDLKKEVGDLKEDLVSADDKTNDLRRELKQYSQDIESLKREAKEKILALIKEKTTNEELKTKIADVEKDRHQLREELDYIRTRSMEGRGDFDQQVNTIISEYEERINEIESKRETDQETIDRMVNIDIPKLQNEIVMKGIQIDNLNEACRLYDCLRYALCLLAIVVVFVFCVYLYLYL